MTFDFNHATFVTEQQDWSNRCRLLFEQAKPQWQWQQQYSVPHKSTHKRTLICTYPGKHQPLHCTFTKRHCERMRKTCIWSHLPELWLTSTWGKNVKVWTLISGAFICLRSNHSKRSVAKRFACSRRLCLSEVDADLWQSCYFGLKIQEKSNVSH